jgi:glycosyltransferase involved in cell wall biosynthesis
LPILRKTFPDVRLKIVGQKPSYRVSSLAQNQGVVVTGAVEDVRPFISEAAVYVVPLRMGSGTRLKILEAMAMGKAIVSTRRGAEGIECLDGRELILADTPDEFATSIGTLLQSEARRKELGGNARRLVEEKYEWKQIVPLFESIYVQQ